MFLGRLLRPLMMGQMSLVRKCMTQSEKAKLQIHLEKVSADSGHKAQPVAHKIISLQREIIDISSFLKDAGEDKELASLGEKDLEALRQEINLLQRQFVSEMTEELLCEEILLEVSAGVGGQEAMLFAQQLFDLYVNYANYKRWNVCPLHQEHTDFGGLRHGELLISSPNAYSLLKNETGVHRVQRVPKTEKSGRIHTSTCGVSILRTLASSELPELPPSSLKIETKRSSGAGGQHVNKTESAVRITHIPSGLTVDCQTERSQIQNRATAIKILRNRLFQQEEEENEKMNRNAKRSQVGSSERSEKMRTVNVLQDRITDHRMGVTIHNVKSYFEGSGAFDSFLNELKEKESSFNVHRFISSH